MVHEQKTLTYKGKIVFEKIKMPSFYRGLKLYKENEFCFMFIDQGELSVRTPDQLISFNNGSALLAKCFNYFFETDFRKKEGSQIFDIIGVIFHQSIVEEVFNYDLSISKFQLGYNVKKIPVDDLFLNFKNSINILLDNPELADDALILTKLREFILLLSKTQNAPSVLDFLSSMFRPVHFDFKTTIEKNLYSNLSLEEFAKLSNMSVSTFKRKFKSIYKKSPGQFFLEKKIEKATFEISKNKMSISQIAYDCGFDSISSFNRNFKKQIGLSPSEFKKIQIKKV